MKSSSFAARFAQNRLAMAGAVILAGITGMALLGPLLYEVNPFDMVGRPFQLPFGEHFLGTDVSGRDILAGLLGGLLAQGYGAWEAACLGVWLHGNAGDHWHLAHPQGAGLNPLHLVDLIPAAWPVASEMP